MGPAQSPTLEKLNDNISNLLMRQGVSVISIFIHLSIFWPNIPNTVIALILFQGLFYAPFLQFAPMFKSHRKFRLRLDATLYGFCIGIWGYNLFLSAFFVASASIINLAAGGFKFTAQSLFMMAVASLLGGYFVDWQFRSDIPILTQAIGSFGLIFFMSYLGRRVFLINTRLRQTRNDLTSQTNELQHLNTLALAVNAHLDVDVIMESMMKTMERIYPFEALYILAFEPLNRKLEVSGIYGTTITFEEHRAFRKFQFDLDRDAHSIFVKSLVTKKAAYFPHITKDMVKHGAQIDQDLFSVKPSVSLAYFPIFVDDNVIGGACFINYDKTFCLDKNDLRKIQQYLVQVGTAVRNATLFKELERSKAIAEKARQEAEASEEAKGRFLANMSHEIRTPLTSIMGYSEALTDHDASEEEKKKFVGHILRSGKHLLSMINDILDISKIDASKIDIERIHCNLFEILCDIESYAVIKCKDKNLQFKIEIEYPIPQHIHSDPTRLKQILLNLCNNAIKFTDDGGVTLKAMRLSDNMLEIKIIDTGIGIDQQEQLKIFSAFEQADTSTTRLYGGTGLGLYISKNLAKLLGGDLSVSSNKGFGSQFILTTLIGNQSESLIETPSQYQAAMEAIRESKTHTGAPTLTGHVLIAEDNLENQNLVDRLIKQTGLTTHVVDDGEKAVKAALNQSYNVILLDMQMPIMGGREAAAKIKAAGIQTPLIAFTANVMKHQIDEYREIGFTAVLEKPINREKLFTTLQSALSNSRSTTCNVLIVEDNEVNQMILMRYVTKNCGNAKVYTALNGAKALEEVNQNEFDLIFMDMEMPIMGGIEATQKIRAQNINTPLYIVTGNVAKEDKARCSEAGATGHLAKPISNEAIQEIIFKHLC